MMRSSNYRIRLQTAIGLALLILADASFFRIKDGIPWIRPILENVTANVWPVNLRWMQTGLRADFWPSQIYSGQLYSENSPMGIMA